MSTRTRGLETVSHGGQGRNGELDPGVDERSLQSMCKSSMCNRKLILSRGFIDSFIHLLSIYNCQVRSVLCQA